MINGQAFAVDAVCSPFEQADVLAGRAKGTSAQFYVAYELDKMAEKYKEAWQGFGVNTDEQAIV